MEIPKKYDPQSTEDKWYEHWTNQGFFNSKPDDRDAYTVVIPPPNVTGVLHMGHMLNNTIQDVLVRRARMLGKNACWVPGTDHASIATEAKVVAKLKGEGINKSDLSRDEFLQHAWDWTEKHGGIILEQLKKLGASCDWNRTRFTMDKDYYDSVIHVFVDLFNQGYIYRGVRMINWDPEALTALSDEEVNYKEVNSRLYYIRYKVDTVDDEWLTIATTRPETILGDTAICINPNDKRYTHLQGKTALVPLINREIPIIFDDYVDMEFGTGCLKVTPAHDPNDYELGLKHNLETIDILSDRGTLNESAQLYVGEDRFAVRKQIAHDLEEQGYLVKSEDHINKIGFSERTDAVIEPKLSLQWFCAMEELSKPALENVMNDTIQFHPPKFKNTYRHWMENIKDWCISRQLWWGHQIPAYYYGKGPKDFVVAKTRDEALELAREKSGNNDLTIDNIRQDEDVLDTWFSSWLWPISVFNGFKEGADQSELEYYYPTNDLVTAPEIMFFWVARMIVAGYKYKGELPFRNVYYTGIVRDKLGRKMSKQLGNSPDPLDLIAKYGADGVRVGMLLSSPAGNDLPFDSAQCEQGRNFTNKIWNAFRLVHSWQDERDMAQPEDCEVATKWFRSKLAETISELEGQYEQFRISEALMITYKLIWDDFCASYLEMVKPHFGHPIDKQTKREAVEFFEIILKLAHPFTPFISEEIWSLLKDRAPSDCITVSEWPEITEEELPKEELKEFPSTWPELPIESSDKKVVDDYKFMQKGIDLVNHFRRIKKLSPDFKFEVVALSLYHEEASVLKWKPIFERITNTTLTLNPRNGLSDKGYSFVYVSATENGEGVDWYINSNIARQYQIAQSVIQEVRKIRSAHGVSPKVLLDLIVNTDSLIVDRSFDTVIEKLANVKLSYSVEHPENSLSFVVGSQDYFVPLNLEVDVEAEISKIKEELDYTKGFLNGVEKKLANERFVQNAPEQVVANERKKQSDAQARIKVLEEKLSSFA